MGSVAEKLAYLLNTKEEIRIAMNAVGASITQEDSFRSYAEKLFNALPPEETGTWTPGISGYEGHSSVIGEGRWGKRGDLVHVYGELWTTERLNPDDCSNTLIGLTITGLPFKVAEGNSVVLRLSDWDLPLDYTQTYSISKNGLPNIQYQSPPEFKVGFAAGSDRGTIVANATIANSDTITNGWISLAAIKGAIPKLILNMVYPIQVV